jgi:hypothetical protein
VFFFFIDVLELWQPIWRILIWILKVIFMKGVDEEGRGRTRKDEEGRGRTRKD